MLSKKDTTKLPLSIKDILDSLEPNSNKTITDLYYEKYNINTDNNDNEDFTNLNYKQKENSILIAHLINSCNGSPEKYENMLRKMFPISITFLCSTIFENPMFFPKHQSSFYYYREDEELYAYSCYTYMIIFPEEGVRLLCSRDFIMKTPYLKNIAENTFLEKVSPLPIKIDTNDSDDENMNNYIEGAYIYVCNAPLDMILYESNSISNENKLKINVSLKKHIERCLNYEY